MDTPSPYQGQERHPVTYAARHIVLRNYPSNSEMENAHRQMDRGWTHIRPNSVLVAAMGNHWRQGNWNRIIDMLDASQEAGIYCGLSEIQDRCFNPYDAIGTMRNEAILTALGEGFQYLCYLDNDVQPEKDTLLKLLRWQVELVAPYVAESGTGHKLFGPGSIEINTGLHRAKWSVLSMLLCHTSMFRMTGPEFWRDAIGADEGYHFQKFHFYGYRLHVDSNTQLTVGGRPLYPLALNRLSSGSMRDVTEAAKAWVGKFAAMLAQRNIPLADGEQAELGTNLLELLHTVKGDREIELQRRIERFVESPDRRPIDPASPWVKDGEYVPFLVKAEQAAKAAATAPASNGVRPSGTLSDVTKALSYSRAGNG